MEYKTVYTKTHTLLIDNDERSLPIGTWVWYDEDNDIYQTERDDFGDGYPHSGHVYEIIASYPKIEGILEFSELPHNDFKNKINTAINYWKTFDGDKQCGIVYGLGLSLEHYGQEKMYSLEDIKKAIQIAQSTMYVEYQNFSGNSKIKHNYDADEIIDTINGQYKFIVYMDYDYVHKEPEAVYYKPKIENNKIFTKWIKVID